MEHEKKHPTLVFLFLFFLILPSEAIASSNSKKHFVLVHGSCHGAWSWYKVMALLKSWGHKVTALDLAASGVNQVKALELQSISQYFNPLTEFMGSLAVDERVVVVGHSLGGLAISHAMEHFPRKISVAVFVTAAMPGPTLNISTLNQESSRRQGPMLDNHYTYDEGPKKPPTTFVFGPRYLASNVYQLSPHQDWDLATTLVRPLRVFSDEDMARVLALTPTRYGSVNRVFVVSNNDSVVVPDFQRWMVAHNPPHRVVQISGSDHMVMMSNPLHLALQLRSIASHCN